MVGIKTQWWLDESALPELIWARLRLHASGGAEIRDCSGETWAFDEREEALHWLSQDEYLPYEELVADGDLPVTVQPPDWPA